MQTGLDMMTIYQQNTESECNEPPTPGAHDLVFFHETARSAGIVPGIWPRPAQSSRPNHGKTHTHTHMHSDKHHQHHLDRHRAVVCQVHVSDV